MELVILKKFNGSDCQFVKTYSSIHSQKIYRKDLPKHFAKLTKKNQDGSLFS